MNKLGRVGKIINWIVFAYLIGITMLTWIGKITYGHGLGDLFFFLGSSVIAIAHLIILITIICDKQEPIGKGNDLFIGMIFLIIAAFFTYKFTFGRGPEYKWRGNVFYSKSEV